MIVSRKVRATPDAWQIRPMRVTTMIANRFVQGAFTLVFSAETTRSRVTGYILPLR